MNDYSEYLNKPGMLAYIEQEWKKNPIHDEHARIVNEFIYEMNPFNVIEIGCGTGQLASKLKTIDYTGIDSNEKCIKLAEEKNPFLDFIKYDIREFSPSRKHGNDLVISFGFLKHFGLDEWFEIFEKVSSIGKYFIFDMPIGETKDDGTEYHHVWKSYEDILKDIEAINFEILKEVHTNKDEICFITKHK